MVTLAMAFENLIRKSEEMLSTVYGWVLSVVCTTCAFLADFKIALFAVLIAVLIDLFWGIAVSIRKGTYAKSAIVRDTYSKASVYGTILIICMICEKLVSEDSVLATRIVASMLCATELWSILGNMLIIYPHIPVIRLFKVALKGEIASKLNITADEVEDALETKKKKRKKNDNDIRTTAEQE